MVKISVEQGLAQAVALYNAGRKDDAHVLCTELLRREPQHPAVHQLEAVLRLEQGDPEQAAEHIAQSLQARPGHAPSMRIAAQAGYELGRLRRERGDTAGAQRAWREAVANQVDLVPAWFALSLVCEDLGDIDEAHAALERVLQIQPDHAEALVNLGLLQQRRGNLEAAMGSYAIAYRHRPQALGRIVNALCSQANGLMWLSLEDLKRELEGALLDE